jgi:hypothetical protein
MADVLDGGALARWQREPISFIEEVLRDPETGRPFELFDAERQFLARAYQRDQNGRLLYPEQRIFASDREIEYINAHALPAEAERLLVAELVARGLRGFVENSVEAVRITRDLRLPAFRFDRHDPYAWPRSRPSLLIASPTKGHAAA